MDDPITGWMFYKEPRRNLQTASSSSSLLGQTHWKTSNWDSKHSSRFDDWLRVFFSFVLGNTYSQSTEGVNCTPINTARTELHSTITRTLVAQAITSQARSSCHVSPFAVTLVFDHEHIIFLSCLSTDFTDPHNTAGTP